MPVVATTTRSASVPVASSTSPSATASTATASALQARARAGWAARCASKAADACALASPVTLEAIWMSGEDLERLATDGAGRTEDGDAASQATRPATSRA